ncbi:MAG TPA: hypothetical protein DCX53_12255 [Anaerolineae bacterium]|nr:hypothetical protein [Anaerolineae bacterium]
MYNFNVNNTANQSKEVFMARKILAWALIVLSSIFFLLSMAGITSIWIYKESLEQEALGRLTTIGVELQQGQAALDVAQMELERALSIVDSTEQSLNAFTQNDPEAFFEDVQTTLNDGLIPELETAKDRLIAARDTLEDLRVTLFGLNLVPFLQTNIPDKTLTDLIDSADSLQVQIKDVGALAEEASTLLDDASNLLGGDLTETRDSLQGFLVVVEEYQFKVTDWRIQIADLIDRTPKWIDNASIILTILLLWFSLSQFSLLLHGRMILREENPLEALRSK